VLPAGRTLAASPALLQRLCCRGAAACRIGHEKAANDACEGKSGPKHCGINAAYPHFFSVLIFCAAERMAMSELTTDRGSQRPNRPMRCGRDQRVIGGVEFDR